jgi:hypothetical protein
LKHTFLFILLILPATHVCAQIDVLFSHDFENQNIGDGPALYVPSGSASPDWDNALFNPFGAGIQGGANQIVSSIDSNNTNMYYLDLTNGDPVLLGANFTGTTDQYVVVEYDVYLTVTQVYTPQARCSTQTEATIWTVQAARESPFISVSATRLTMSVTPLATALRM